MKTPNYEFILARISGCKTVDDTYVIFHEISDYIETYNVSCIMYKKLFDKTMDKYKEIEKNRLDNQAKS